MKFQKDSSLINKEIQNTTKRTLLKSGNPFDLDVIKAERERIDNRLKEKGFIIFIRIISLFRPTPRLVKPSGRAECKLKDDTPKLSKEQFTIDKVVVFPNYNLQDVRKGCIRFR